jgi:hypothetical protein
MALVFRDRMWLLGGWNPGDKVHFPKICNSEVWSSRDGREWTRELLQAPWEGRHYAGCAVHRDRMWIVGGDVNQGHYHNDVWNSNDGVHWKQVTNTVPWGSRWAHHTVVFEDKIWVMGGQTQPQFAPADEAFYCDVWNSSDGIAWTRVCATAPWCPRSFIGGSAVLNGRMWIVGGGTYDTPGAPVRAYHNDVWSTADGINWECQTRSAPWARRQMHDVAVFDGKLWVMEGWNEHGGGNQKDVWYSPDGVDWHEVPDTPWQPRHAASVFVYDDALWLVAGNNMKSDVWKLSRRRPTQTAHRPS